MGRLASADRPGGRRVALRSSTEAAEAATSGAPDAPAAVSKLGEMLANGTAAAEDKPGQVLGQVVNDNGEVLGKLLDSPGEEMGVLVDSTGGVVGDLVGTTSKEEVRAQQNLTILRTDVISRHGYLTVCL